MNNPTSFHDLPHVQPTVSSRTSTAHVEKVAEDTRTRKHRITVRWWILASLAFLIMSPIISILLGLHLHTRDFQYLDNKSTFGGRTVLLEVVLISADPIGGTMTMDWTVIGESQSDCSSGNLAACSDVNIFFDNNLLSGSDPATIPNSDRPETPLFRFNASSFASKDSIAKTPTFRTDLALFSPNNHRSALMYYPFDNYLAEMFVFAQDASTNVTIGLRLAEARGIAVGFMTNAVTRPNANTAGGIVDVLITLSRAPLVKTYSIVATMAIWLITLVLLLVMITAVFFNFRQKGEVLVIPVTTLFAFTQLRQSMPGAPAGFGDIVDFVGLLPCLVLLSLSSAITLGAFVLSDPTEHPQKLSWDLWYQAFPSLQPKNKDPEHLV